MNNLYDLNAKQNEIAVAWLADNVPSWCDDLDASTVSSVCEGGCDSGAYMPAVTYHIANGRMSIHGDVVLEFIEEIVGELPAIPENKSWSAIASYYLAYAVELFAQNAESCILELIENMDA